jgi:hypothetical protein
VRRGSTLNVEIQFKAATATSSLKPIVKGEAYGVDMEMDIPKDLKNACNNLKNEKCPLTKGQTVTYSVKFPILSAYPKIETEITVKLVGDNKKTQMCIRLDGEVI